VRGRKPIPTSVKLLEGRRVSKAERDRAELIAGEVLPLPAPPEHLDEYAREEWEELSPGLARLGLFGHAYHAIYEAYCCQYAIHRRAQEELKAHLAEGGSLAYRAGNGKDSVHPILAVIKQSAQQVKELAGELGLSPIAQARLAKHAPGAPTMSPEMEGNTWPNAPGQPGHEEWKARHKIPKAKKRRAKTRDPDR
jgi:P27 family predicted phage terminase small subunit